jgi:hypothetical protein
MAVRERALAAFYGGATWQAHKAVANATMVDSDNVLLLRPVAGDLAQAAGSAGAGGTGSLYTVHMHYLGDVDVAGFSAFFDAEIMPRLDSFGVVPVARFVTEKAANNFPRLPIRERASMYVWMLRWGTVPDYGAFSERWTAQEGWRDTAPEGLLPVFMRKPEVLRLSPTARSPLQ